MFGKAYTRSGKSENWREFKQSKIDNTRLFTGREYDQEIGLYYYRARYYDSELGRFISRDPIGQVDDVNLYGYVGNNPVMGVDPSGKVKKCIDKHITGFTVLGTFAGLGVASIVNEEIYYGEVFLAKSIANKNNIYNPGDGYTKTFMKSDDYTTLFTNIKENIKEGDLNDSGYAQANKSSIGLLTLGHYDYTYDASLNNDGNFNINIKITDIYDFNYEKDKKGFMGWYLNTMHKANNYSLLLPTKTEINIKDIILGK